MNLISRSSRAPQVSMSTEASYLGLMFQLLVPRKALTVLLGTCIENKSSEYHKPYSLNLCIELTPAFVSPTIRAPRKQFAQALRAKLPITSLNSVSPSITPKVPTLTISSYSNSSLSPKMATSLSTTSARRLRCHSSTKMESIRDLTH